MVLEIYCAMKTVNQDLVKYINSLFKTENELNEDLSSVLNKVEIEKAKTYENFLRQSHRIQNILKITKEQSNKTKQKLDTLNYTESLYDFKEKKEPDVEYSTSNLIKLRRISDNLSLVIDRLEKVSSWESTLEAFQTVVENAVDEESLNEAYKNLSLVKTSVIMLQDFKGNEDRRNSLLKAYSQVIEKFMTYEQVTGKILHIFITLCIELRDNNALPPSLTSTLDKVTKSFALKEVSKLKDINLVEDYTAMSSYCDDLFNDNASLFISAIENTLVLRLENDISEYDTQKKINLLRDLFHLIANVDKYEVWTEVTSSVEKEIFKTIIESADIELGNIKLELKNKESAQDFKQNSLIQSLSELIWTLPEQIETLNLPPSVEILKNNDNFNSFCVKELNSKIVGYADIVEVRKNIFLTEDTEWLAKCFFYIIDKFVLLTLTYNFEKVFSSDFAILKEISITFFDFEDILLTACLSASKEYNDTNQSFQKIVTNNVALCMKTSGLRDKI